MAAAGAGSGGGAHYCSRLLLARSIVARGAAHLADGAELGVLAPVAAAQRWRTTFDGDRGRARRSGRGGGGGMRRRGSRRRRRGRVGRQNSAAGRRRFRQIAPDLEIFTSRA